MKKFLTLCGALLLLGSVSLSAQNQRVVLIEDFSSVTCQPCGEAARNVAEIAKANGDKVVSIQYHLDIPGRFDPFYAQNKPHQDARRGYYESVIGGSINSLPRVYIDGEPVATNKSEMTTSTASQVTVESPIKLTVTQAIEGGAIKADVKLEGADNLLSGNRLYVVAVEKLVVREAAFFSAATPYYDETEFHDLFRTFASAPEGVEVGSKATEEFSYSITLQENWDPQEMYVIAWVQDEFNGVIAGTGFSKATNSVERSDGAAGYEITSVAPNPASSEDVTFSFALAAPQQVSAALYNAAGELVRQVEVGAREAGEHQVSVETSDLPNGTYHLRVEGGPLQATRTLQIVR